MTRATLGLALAAGACDREPQRPVSRVDVALTVLRDGALEVSETIHLAATRPVTSFRRTLPAGRYDDIVDVKGTLDGAPLPNAPGEQWLEVSSSRDLDVTWHLPAMSGEHALGLTYRAVNAVHVSGIRGRIAWLAMASGRDFEIGDMTITLTLPDGVVQLEDPGVMESGWTVTREPRGMRATRSTVPASDSVTAGAEFTIDGLRLAQPTWQYQALRAAEFRPAFLSAGAFLLVVAAGILVMIRVRLAGLEPGMTAEGERRSAARGLRISAVVTLVAGALGGPLVAATLGTFGPWPYALPACTLISGVLFLWYGHRLSPSRLARQ